jgi:RND family efflux transporter MFP subunit
MNKYVLRTSLVWLAILLIAIGIVSSRNWSVKALFHPAAQPLSRSGEVQPEVSGPAAGRLANHSMAPSPATSEEEATPALAAIQLTPERMQSIGVQTGEVQYRQVSNDVRATGNVDTDERLVSYVQVRFSGYIRKVFANATFQYVRSGEPLFTVYSPELVATQQEYLLAKRNKRMLAASTVDGVASGAEALEAAAEQRLVQWQVPDSELNKLRNTGKPITDVTINSPVSGYITERNALPNMYVEPSTRLYTIADLSRVWVYAQVIQDDVGRLKPGDAAQITVDAYPGRTFRAHVETILPQVDLATRTVRVRLELANPGLKLKPGMFVNVLLENAAGRALVIPTTAVIQSGMRQLVFLDDGNGNLRPKEVTLGTRVGDDYLVLSGLTEHQKIVTSANFLIDSESQLQAAAGAFSPPPPGTSGSQGSTPPGTQANLDLSTDPNPAQRGNNVFHVKVTDPAGVPVTGANVTVKFYMAGMPAMGMSAMDTTSNLTEKGGGAYEGIGKLESGGTWQVTITAQKGGKTVATKQLRVIATGGI